MNRVVTGHLPDLLFCPGTTGGEEPRGCGDHNGRAPCRRCDGRCAGIQRGVSSSWPTSSLNLASVKYRSWGIRSGSYLFFSLFHPEMMQQRNYWYTTLRCLIRRMRTLSEKIEYITLQFPTRNLYNPLNCPASASPISGFSASPDSISWIIRSATGLSIFLMSLRTERL